MTAIWWVRDDQRIHNNPTLGAALAWRERTGGKLVAVWPTPFTKTISYAEFKDPLPRISPMRLAYVQACFDSLKIQLQEELEVEAITVSGSVRDYVLQTKTQVVFFTFGAAFEERQEEAELEKTEVELNGYYSRTLLQPQHVFSSSLPPTYTPFRKRVEALLGTHSFSGITTLEDSGRLASALFHSAEHQARAHVYAYISENGPGREYKTRRNGMLHHLDSTKLSAYLSRGLISPQEVWNRCLAVEGPLGGCEETYWIRFELLWREYFQWVAYESGPRLFMASGLKKHSETLNHTGSRKAFELWTSGKTGDELVDAAMRELRETGYQSNRARQNAASYWIHDMKQPWRIGAAYFECMLLDYDPASNWGNWAYIAGVGNDPRPFRKFHTQKQAEQYDPEGSYRAYWSGQ